VLNQFADICCRLNVQPYFPVKMNAPLDRRFFIDDLLQGTTVPGKEIIPPASLISNDNISLDRGTLQQGNVTVYRFGAVHSGAGAEFNLDIYGMYFTGNRRFGQSDATTNGGDVSDS